MVRLSAASPVVLCSFTRCRRGSRRSSPAARGHWRRAFVPRGFANRYGPIAPSSRGLGARRAPARVRGSKVARARCRAREDRGARARSPRPRRRRAADDYRMATPADATLRSPPPLARTPSACSPGRRSRGDADAAVEDAVVAEEAVAVAARVAARARRRRPAPLLSRSTPSVPAPRLRPSRRGQGRASCRGRRRERSRVGRERAEARLPEDRSGERRTRRTRRSAAARAQAEEDDAQRRADESNEEEAQARRRGGREAIRGRRSSDYYFDLCVDRAADEATIKSPSASSRASSTGCE